jgi:RNA polymerase sigma-32 factor
MNTTETTEKDLSEDDAINQPTYRPQVKDLKAPSPSYNTALSSYLRRINQFPSLSAEEEFLLAKNYLEKGDMQAAHKLITSHLKLVAKIALSHRNYNVPVIDLISEGNIGLMRAVKKYNPDMGHRLSTYAMWWIKAMIQDHVMKSWSLVKSITTSEQKKLFFMLRKLKQKIARTHERISHEEYEQIATELQIKASEVREMDARWSSSDISLNQPKSSSEEGRELIDFVPENKPNQETALVTKQEAQMKQKLLGEALAILQERELYILKKRHLSSTPLTLQDLSDELKISKERVRQIESHALSKMRKYVRLHNDSHS